jgi:hypothetical protein
MSPPTDDELLTAQDNVTRSRIVAFLLQRALLPDGPACACLVAAADALERREDLTMTVAAPETARS